MSYITAPRGSPNGLGMSVQYVFRSQLGGLRGGGVVEGATEDAVS